MDLDEAAEGRTPPGAFEVPIRHLGAKQTNIGRELFPSQPQLDDHPFLASIIDQKVAMKENVAIFLKMRPRDGFAPMIVGVKGRGPEDYVLTVELTIALANRHRRLPRVVPHRSETIRFGIEARDPSASAFRSIGIEEGEIRLQKLAVLDHVLLTRSFRHDRLSAHREECLHDAPFARKLREQLLASPGAFRGSY